MDLVNNYECTCDVGYMGINCEIDINECDPDPCNSLSNESTCIDLIGQFEVRFKSYFKFYFSYFVFSAIVSLASTVTSAKLILMNVMLTLVTQFQLTANVSIK